MRILLVLQQDFAEEVYIKAIEAFYHALWRDGVDFTAPEIPRTLLSSLSLPGNPDMESIIQKAESEEVKELLDRNTQQVLDQGGFGLPWIKGSFSSPQSCSLLYCFSLLPDKFANMLLVCFIIATNAKGETDTWWGVDQLTQVAGFLELDWPEGETEKDPKIRHML